jgi:hypothetical protein
MEKRKVKVVERTYPQGYRSPAVIKDVGEGIFHVWGVNYEEFESGTGNYSVAIVEMQDGSVVEALPQDVIFIDSVKA